MRNLLINIITVLFVTATLNSQGYTWRQLGSPSVNGTNGYVFAITIYNGRIIVGGSFNTAGGLQANNIASYDPVTQLWSPLGAGISGEVKTLAVYGGQLYAGGQFNSPGSNIARWNGSTWSNVGSGTNGQVLALHVFSNNLIVGGQFNNAGGVSASNIAIWNGSTWSALGSGLTGSGSRVRDISVLSGDIVACGRFNVGSGNNVARWNGTQWVAFGSQQFDDEVNAVVVFNGQLYAGGKFEQIGSADAKYIARWTGSQWEEVGGGLNDNEVTDITVYGGELIVSGNFKFAGTGNLYVDRIAAWNGTNWYRLLSGMNDKVEVVYSSQTDTLLYAGGEFTSAGGKWCNHVSVWGNFEKISVSGAVRYSDNNQPVPSGIVKAVRYDVSSREIITVDSIQFSNGSYTLSRIPRNEADIRVIVFPDDELLLNGGTNDFIPTYHPSSIVWTSANVVNTSTNQLNINVNVIRRNPPLINSVTANISGFVYLNILPPLNMIGELPYLKGAIVYARLGGSYVRAAQSNSLQQYTLSGLNPGTYELIVTRLGYETESRVITLGAVNLDTVNFYLDTLNPIGISNNQNQIPEAFILLQNFPNPFNPVTEIEFIISEITDAELAVFDSKGAKVYSTGNIKYTPGLYRISFDGTHLSSGVYFYTLVSEKYIQSRKMVLVK